MSSSEYLYDLPPAVWFEFCRLMDGLAETQWVRFASEVLSDQTDLRLAERRERRTDYVMNQWANRNGRVWELIGLLERQQLLRARDLILTWRGESVSRPRPHPCHSQFDPALMPYLDPSSLPTKTLTTAGEVVGGARMLPKPGPPPSILHSGAQPLSQVEVMAPAGSLCGAGVMCWSHDEVEKGTQGFSPSLLVGEGGFGTVYQACMRNTSYAVKRLKQDSSLLDWSLVKESFKTEVEKLSQYRHPNILELMGFSVGVETFCLLYSFMSNGSLESQLVCGTLSWIQRVCAAEGASRALQFLHLPPPPHLPLIHGDVKSSNILLDLHLVPKLGDFGLAVFSPRVQGGVSVRTGCVGKTSSLRGTQAYLPQDYLQDRRATTSLDVYSFGVVLLEVLTGRRAVETEGSRTLYLKDLVAELEEAPSLSQSCSRHLDTRLLPHNAASSGGVAGCVDVATLACRCLHKSKKKRPAMTEVFEELQGILSLLKSTTSAPSSLLVSPTSSEVGLGALVRDMAQLGTQGHSSSTSLSLSQPCESDESICLPTGTLCGAPTGSQSSTASCQSGSQSSTASSWSVSQSSTASSWSGSQSSTASSWSVASSCHPTQGCSSDGFLPLSQPPSSTIQTGEEMHSGCSGPEESDELDFLN